MKYLVIQETDWRERLPIQHHQIFERLSINGDQVTVIDYPIDWNTKNSTVNVGKWNANLVSKIMEKSKIRVITPPIIINKFFARISSVFSHWIAIKNIIRTDKPDVVILFSVSNAIPAIILAKLNQIPIIFYSMDIIYALQPVKIADKLAFLFERFTLNNCTHIFLLSKTLLPHIKKLKVRTSLSLIPLGLDSNLFNLNKSKNIILYEKYNLNKNKTYLCFVGHLFWFSGMDITLSVLRKLPLNIDLIIVGDGEYRNNIEQKISEYNLTNRVVMTGRVSQNEVAEFLSLSDILLIPFINCDITKNIVPIKAYEYLATGKPIIMSKLPGLWSEFKNSPMVYFFDTENSYKSKILKIIGGDKNEIETKKNKYEEYTQSIHNKHDWELIIELFEKKVTKIIKEYRIEQSI